LANVTERLQFRVIGALIEALSTELSTDFVEKYFFLDKPNVGGCFEKPT